MKSFRSFQESCGKDQVFTSELKSYYIVHFYQLMLDLKQCDLVGTPYLNAQISDSSDLEYNVQSPQSLSGDEHKVYCYMEKDY